MFGFLSGIHRFSTTFDTTFATSAQTSASTTTSFNTTFSTSQVTSTTFNTTFSTSQVTSTTFNTLRSTSLATTTTFNTSFSTSFVERIPVSGYIFVANYTQWYGSSYGSQRVRWEGVEVATSVPNKDTSVTVGIYTYFKGEEQ